MGLAERRATKQFKLGRPLPLTLATDVDDEGRRAIGTLLPMLADVLVAIASDDMGKEALASFDTVEVGAASNLEVYKEDPRRIVVRAPKLLTANVTHASLRAAIEKLL